MKKEKSLTNFVAENTSSSIEEASENVKNLNIDYNQVDNRALLSVLIKSDSNKKDADSDAMRIQIIVNYQKQETTNRKMACYSKHEL